MCGICGIVSLNNSSGNNFLSAVERMSSVMSHRGPDDSNIEVVGNACFGHRRLSILDTSSNGRQPFLSNDLSVGMITNGEIYNYKILRDQLKKQGSLFKSKSDSEVILEGYLSSGVNYVKNLRGMFAYALHDKKNNTTVLVRDRQGIKPLYYYCDDEVLIFSSEMNSLLESGFIERKLNAFALKQYVEFGYMPEPNTLVENIKMLQPGHQLLIQNSILSIEPYWSAPLQEACEISTDLIVKKTKELLEDSIKVHMQSDVPVGVFLSGGIDSTVITGLASQISKAPVQTFSLGFKENKEALDETQLASQVAKYFKTNHQEINISGKDVLENLDNIIGSMSQPSLDGINTYFVSKAASEAGVKVVLSGLGGDELFGGYGSFKLLPKVGIPLKLWLFLHARIREKIISFFTFFVRNYLYKLKLSRLKKVHDFVDLYFLIRSNGPSSESHDIFSKNFNQLIEKNSKTNVLSDLKHGKQFKDLWRETQRLEIKNYMQWRLLRDSDAMSMAHSIELRVPLIDDALVEQLLSLPEGWHKKLGWPKKLLVESMHNLIPSFVLNKKKKGFQLPMDVWMFNELNPIIKEVFSINCIRNRGIFQEDYMLNLYELFMQGKIPYEHIWKFVVLELWLKKLNIS